jgi:YfiR/HmsC-like
MIVRRYRFFGLAVAVLTALLPSASKAQSARQTTQALEAAFLYNFTKFTEWPSEALPPAAPLVLCIAGDSVLQKALEEVTKGRLERGHPLVIRRVEVREALNSCHVLYVADLNSKRALQLLEKLNGAPVLSVSNFTSFAQLGGSVHFFSENGRMRFAVNLDATQRTKLRLSSLLLNLAKIVKDDPSLNRH